MSTTILAFGLTPGDIEMACGGSTALLARQGYRVIHVFLAYQGEDCERLRPEAGRAAAILDADSVRFLRLGKGPELFTRNTMLATAGMLRELRPEIIFTYHSLDPAPEHHGLSCMIKTAAVAAGMPEAPDLENDPWQVSTIYGYELRPPMTQHEMAVNITATMESKREAIMIYSDLPGADYADAMQGLAAYRGATSRAGKYAEVFEILHGQSCPYFES